MRSVFAAAVAVCVVLATGHAAEPSAEKRAAGLAKMAHRIDVEAAQRELATCQGLLQHALAQRNTEAAKKARDLVTEAKRQLARARARSASDYLERARRVANRVHGERADQDEDNPVLREDLTPGEFALEKIRHGGPLLIGGVVLEPNSIGVPEVTVYACNLSDRTVEAYDVEIQCWDSFGEPVMHGDDNILRATSQQPIRESEIAPATWMLAVQETTTRVAVRITRIKPEYGNVWDQTREEAERSPGAIVEAKIRR